jgi:hypothetical protein
MMDSVFKHSVALGGITHLWCGEILHFGEQHGQFFVWARTSDGRSRTVQLVTTGVYMELEDRRHVGTVITDNGDFVVHAFAS